jgi:hypothetical protein
VAIGVIPAIRDRSSLRLHCGQRLNIYGVFSMDSRTPVVTTIELTEPERDFLIEILASAERELLTEISRTDTREYRETLEDRLTLLETVRARITSGM